MTKEWYKLAQKLATRFRGLVAGLRIATVAKISIKDVTNLASIYSHFVCSVRFVTDCSECGFQNDMCFWILYLLCGNSGNQYMHPRMWTFKNFKKNSLENNGVQFWKIMEDY